MSYVYKCTGWEKYAEVDDYEKGCDGKGRCVASDQIRPIAAKSMPELIKKVGEYFGLELDDVWVGNLESGSIGFNRLEDGAGFEPTPTHLEEWKRGDRTLYLCDYTFFIEKHALPVPLTPEDFEGVKTHA
ncbi:MAG: hypothetical protein E6R03_07270 [Hyphomicrobiaceae bacterium]|nr:MAG: hypothetical protein E6R03_07270 [Hyphomicrobiaceae bacterium]